jgi:phospholipid/cholesterol/gamma-HCH transport system permease protein
VDEIDVQIDGSAAPVLVKLTGSLDRFTVPGVYRKIKPYCDRGQNVALDVREISRIDSAGVALIAHGLRKVRTGGGGFRLRTINPAVSDALRLAGWNVDAPERFYEEDTSGFVESVGAEASVFGEFFYQLAYLLSEVFYNGLVRPFAGQKPRFRILFEQLARLGAGSAPIVLLVAVLVGLTTAFQGAEQLNRFGANIYIANLVGISMMRELGPLMAAILVAGRSGAAITAEIGTMKVNEEIDALKLLGINPIQYLAVPRFYAITIAQPLLGVISALAGIMGGWVIAVTYLGLNSSSFMNQLLLAMGTNDLVFNLVKSMVFGWLIVIVGVHYGFQVSGGAAGVGRATTNSVVVAIVMIIFADCLFSFT